MTYKLANLGVRLWAVLYAINSIFALALIVRALVSDPVNQPLVAIGFIVMGSGMWPARKLLNYYRLRRQITKAWEKQFDDVEFLEFHARQNWRFQGIQLRDSFPGMRSALWCVSKLWAGRKTSEWVHLDSKAADDVVRDIGAKIPENVPEFYRCLLAGVLYGVIEPTISDPRALLIGPLVFQCAKEHYPLKKFKMPNDNQVAEPAHAA